MCRYKAGLTLLRDKIMACLEHSNFKNVIHITYNIDLIAYFIFGMAFYIFMALSFISVIFA